MTEEEILAIIQELIDLNQSLISKQQQIKERIERLESNQREVVDYLTELTNETKKYNHVTNKVDLHDDVLDMLLATVRNLKYELADISSESYFHPHIMTMEDSIACIISKRKSLARFGDGEFGLIFGESRMYFQDEDDRLGCMLLEVLHSDEQNLLIGIVDIYGSLEQFTEVTQFAWRRFLTPEYRYRQEQLLSKDRVYANARLSRPYAEQSDMHTDAPAKRFQMLKQIWYHQKVVIIEGSKTGMGVGNDLFADVSDIRRIVCPAENAFNVYDDILTEALKLDKDCLILLALGPTATVLAYDLCRAGYWAVDIGHIDLEYEWFLRETGGRTRIEGKYVNEVLGGQDVADIHDEVYDSQVISRIGC